MSWVTSKCTVHERAEPKTPWNSAAVHYLCQSQLGLFLVPQDDLVSCSHVYFVALQHVDPLGKEVVVFQSFKPILFVVHHRWDSLKALAACSTGFNSIFQKEGERLHVLVGSIKKAMVVIHSLWGYVLPALFTALLMPSKQFLNSGSEKGDNWLILCSIYLQDFANSQCCYSIGFIVSEWIM